MTYNPVTCESYEHMGQHGAADYYHVIHSTKPASIGSEELKKELTGIGYNITRAYKQSQKDRDSIREQIRREKNGRIQ